METQGGSVFNAEFLRLSDELLLCSAGVPRAERTLRGQDLGGAAWTGPSPTGPPSLSG
jgi:hypothetical protein